MRMSLRWASERERERECSNAERDRRRVWVGLKADRE